MLHVITNKPMEGLSLVGIASKGCEQGGFLVKLHSTPEFYVENVNNRGLESEAAPIMVMALV